jgi:ABC-type antimicrobial peptide transport system permease subunit
MNKKQKYFLVIGIILIAAALLYWFSQGAEILTKTQVLVDKTSDLDKMLGVKNEQYVDKFVLGLDYAGGFSAAVAVISGIFIYLFRNKKKEIK